MPNASPNALNCILWMNRCAGASSWGVSEFEKEEVGLYLFTCVYLGWSPNQSVPQFLTRKMSVMVIGWQGNET